MIKFYYLFRFKRYFFRILAEDLIDEIFNSEYYEISINNSLPEFSNKESISSLLNGYSSFRAVHKHMELRYVSIRTQTTRE